MFEGIKRWQDCRRQDAVKKRTLARDGFVAYCECRVMLNGSSCERQDDDTYIYTCLCGFKSRFFFGAPVPIRIQAWDSAGRELGGGTSGWGLGEPSASETSR